VKKPIPFGKYYLLERVNVGGMAEVFKAKAFGVEGFERLLAVKRILPNIAEDKEFIEMFIDEAKIAVQLNHANIAQIFDLGKVEDSFFIALEFVHGKDLRSIFDRGRQVGQIMPIAQACFVIMKVCEGLDYAHNKRDASGRELNLVHRDVSPQNVLVSYEGEIKLIDFGIAKAAGKASKTQAGILKGKFGYMSPEQVRGLPIDRRSDIFSVGIVLYELLTGERLFVGESDFSTLEKVRNVEILPPSTYNRKIPDELERIVLKTLAKDVEDRYQNAIDLHDDLQAFMYTAGEFYSRKDLAAWMKKTFAAEIEEETRKLEEYRAIPAPDPHKFRPVAPPRRPPSLPPSAPPPPPPDALSHPNTPRSTLLGMGSGSGYGPPGAQAPAASLAAVPASLGSEWDDEELETQIYDKPDGHAAPFAEPTGEVEIEEPSGPHVLPPISRPPISEPISPLPAPPVALTSTMPGAPTPPSERIPLPGIDVPLDTPPPVARSFQGTTLPPPGGAQIRPLGVSGFGARASSTPTRGVGTLLAVVAGMLVVSVGAVLGFYSYSHRSGSILVTSFPSDVQVLIDQVMVAKETPFTVDKPPGTYQVTVQREGYEAAHQVVEVKAGRRSELRAELVPLAGDIGFVLESEPPGQPAHLDGKLLTGLTPMKVTRISSGRHLVEVKGGACYGPWSQEVMLEAGKQPVRLNAKLRPMVVQVRIQSEPPHAKAYLIEGGRRAFAGETPAQVKLDPTKRYAVALVHNGYKETTQDIKFDGSCDLTVDAALDRIGVGNQVVPPPPLTAEANRPKERTDLPAPLPKPPREHAAPKPPRVGPDRTSEMAMDSPREKPAGASASGGKGQGFLKVGARPWMKITIDGEDFGNTPNPKISLPAGKHKLQLANPQFDVNFTQTIEIRPNDTLTIIKNFEKEEKTE